MTEVDKHQQFLKIGNEVKLPKDVKERLKNSIDLSPILGNISIKKKITKEKNPENVMNNLNNLIAGLSEILKNQINSSKEFDNCRDEMIGKLNSFEKSRNLSISAEDGI